MTQLTRSTNDVIVNALLMISELGVGETPDAFMLTTGLSLINEVIDQLSAAGIYIPYLTTLSHTFVPGQGDYSITDMIPGADIVDNRIVELTFANYDVPTTGSTKINYPITIIDKSQFNMILRQTDLKTRIGFAFLNNQPEKSIVTFYPLPDQPYDFTIQCKLMLNEFTNQSSLKDIPPYFYAYLKYAVAKKFALYYPSSNWTPAAEEEYTRTFKDLTSGNEIDLVVKTTAILESPAPVSWPNILSFP